VSDPELSGVPDSLCPATREVAVRPGERACI
jgi:hypothetical protein